MNKGIKNVFIKNKYGDELCIPHHPCKLHNTQEDCLGDTKNECAFLTDYEENRCLRLKIFMKK